LYDERSDTAVIRLGEFEPGDDTDEGVEDVWVLWRGSQVVGVAVQNASQHLPGEILGRCGQLNTLGLPRFE
jgi:uncharacterized protein YuzE